MTDNLIITLSPHPKFGYLLYPFFASYNPVTEVYAIVEAATEAANSANYAALSEDEKQIVKTSDRYADKELMKRYSREKSESDFIKNVTQETIDRYIRPFIEARHRELLHVQQLTNTPVFLRQKTQIRDFRASNLLHVLREPSEMIFIFKNLETFSYTVQVRNNKKDINLFQQVYIPLCNKPAKAVIGNQIHTFNDVDEKKLQPFFTKRFIEVPQRNVPVYVEKFVYQCVKNYEVETEGITLFEQKYAPSALLTIEIDFQLKPVLNLQFCYGHHKFSIDKPYKKEVEIIETQPRISIGWFYRDERWESNCIRILKEGGLETTPSGRFCVSASQNDESNSGGVIEWLNKNRELLHHFELKQSVGERVYFTGEISLQFNAEEKRDWFDINCIAYFGAIEIPFIRFRNHILNNVNEYVLPNNQIAVLPSEWFARFDELFRFGKMSNSTVHLKKHHFRVKELAEKGFFPNKETVQLELPTDIPISQNTTLRNYQVHGYRWMLFLRQNAFGGCLADDMGLGKTVQTIALLLHVYSETKENENKPVKSATPIQLSLFDEPIIQKVEPKETPLISNTPPTLIVMPTSLVHNWKNELTKFAPQLKVYAHTGPDRFQLEEFAPAMECYQIILTSYGIVRQDIDFLQHFHFEYLILDESQHIKNPFSQTYSCIKKLTSNYKLALTGTPIENSLSDLWSQMNFLNDGILGSHAQFRNQFQDSDVITDEKGRDRLLKIVDPFILRRTKEEVAPELPPLTQEIWYCEMSDEQAAIYKEEKNKARNAMLEKAVVDGSSSHLSAMVLSSLTKLRLLANHPAISYQDYKGESGKFEQIIEQAEILFARKHKVLIFSSFVKHLELFAAHFQERGWKYAWLTGKTKEREAEIDKFNSNSDIQAFFISLKAGGTGLNLTAADYVFILDPWWNPAAEMQAVSRAHRIGQDKKVTLYRFITKDSVEEKIERLQRYKTAMADAVIAPRLTWEEMEELLE